MPEEFIAEARVFLAQQASYRDNHATRRVHRRVREQVDLLQIIYDMEAVGVSHWVKALNAELSSVQCDMLYAEHYINYTI